MSNHPDAIEHSFTLIDDTGSRRLSDQQRLQLMIALETEEPTDDPLDTATRLALIADSAQAPGAAQAAQSLVGAARPREVRDAAKGVAGRVLGSEEVMV